MIDLDKFKDVYNNLPLDYFSGLSPAQMYQILYLPKESGILEIQDSTEANIEIPFLMLLKELIENIDFSKGLKLTATGNLPVKTVKNIYEKRIILDFPIEHGITKLSKETDFLALNCVKIIGKMSGFLRKSKNRIFVTKKGQKFKESKNLSDILYTFGLKFNKAYYDGYIDESISQQDFIFSLYLLSIYGGISRNTKFYGDKYFMAFPQVGNDLRDRNHCYILRTFKIFFKLFGFIEITGNFDNEKIITTKLFNKYIKIC